MTMYQPPPPQEPLPVPPPWPVEGLVPWAPLILSNSPMKTAARITAQPGRALVYSDENGVPVRLSKPPGRWQARSYHWRYEVDLSDHHVVLRLEVPSKSPAVTFQLTVHVGWRVSDPVRIVESRVDDGNGIVRARVIEMTHPVCRSYTIEQDGALESNLTRSLGGDREHVLPEGITIFRLVYRVHHGAQAAGWIVEDVEAERRVKETERGMMAMRQQLRTQDDLVRMLLHRNPDQVHEIIADIQRRKEMSEQQRLSLFNQLLDKDLIQEADMDWARQVILQPIEEIITATPTGAFGIEQPVSRPPLDRVGSGQASGAMSGTEDEEDEEDVMPAQVVQGSVDGVSEWRPLPWQREDR